MDERRESGMAIITWIVILIIICILYLCCSCRSARQISSEVRKHETLSLSSERLTSSHLSDILTQLITMKADSIVLLYNSDNGMPGEQKPDSSGQSADNGVTPLSNLRMESSVTPSSDRSGKAAKKWGGFPDQKVRNPASLQAVKIYAPHIAASSEERSVVDSSSTDSSDFVEQSDSEEDTVRKYAPTIKEKISWVIIVALALMLFVRYYRTKG